MDGPVLFVILAIIGLIGVAIIIIANINEDDYIEPDLSELGFDDEADDEENTEDYSPPDLSAFFADQLADPEENDFSENELNKVAESLPFEPINTFELDPSQHSDLNQDLNRFPWPKSEQKANIDYDDRTSPDMPSKSIHKAVEWLLGANTEAIHQRSQYQKYISHLLPFIEHPRAAGVEAIAAVPWRERAANMSRLVGERLLAAALGLSCHGSVEMDAHLEALGGLLSETWNKDGLEQCFLYQCVGRLGILTPTDTSELQKILAPRINGLVQRGDEPTKLDQARLNALLLSISSSEDYPFPTAEGQLSRLWHWDENAPPLVRWGQLLPFLYALWIHHWIKDERAGAVRDIAAMLGSWWDNHPPASDLFENKPELWEAILMTAWALVPNNKLVWDKLQERFEALEISDSQLIDISNGYFNWHKSYVEDEEIPAESFCGRRMPPQDWIYPLPSDLFSDRGQPSFEYPKTWLDALFKIEPPNYESLQRT